MSAGMPASRKTSEPVMPTGSFVDPVRLREIQSLPVYRVVLREFDTSELSPIRLLLRPKGLSRVPCSIVQPRCRRCFASSLRAGQTRDIGRADANIGGRYERRSVDLSKPG